MRGIKIQSEKERERERERESKILFLFSLSIFLLLLKERRREREREREREIVQATCGFKQLASYLASKQSSSLQLDHTPLTVLLSLLLLL